jgi:predicted metal-dependent hydrolase
MEKQKKQFIIKDKLYNFNIYLEKRNNSRASITKNSTNIRVPRNLSMKRQEKEINELIKWAIKTIENSPVKEEIKKVYSNLDKLIIYDIEYTLYIIEDFREKNLSKVIGKIIEFRLSHKYSEEEKQEYIRKKLKKIIEKLHLKEIEERVHKINEVCFNQKIDKVTIKYMNSKWGHCTSKNEICLSTRLLLAPKAVLNYVIVHELAHLIEMNHSKKFWEIVKSVDKTYKIKLKWLKDYGHTLVL